MAVARVPECTEHGRGLTTSCWVGQCSRCDRPIHLSTGHPRPYDPCTRCTPTVGPERPPAEPTGLRRRVSRAEVLQALLICAVLLAVLAWRDLT